MKNTTKLGMALLATWFGFVALTAQNIGSQQLGVRNIEKKLIGDKCEAYCAIDYPQGGNKILTTAIIRYLNQEMGGTYQGRLSDGYAMVDHYARRSLDALREIRIDGEGDMVYYESFVARKTYETDRIVTYEMETDLYTGGAHSNGSAYGVTFDKRDGRRIDLNVMTVVILSPGPDWKQIIKDGMKAYFEVETDDELRDILYTDIDNLPLPRTRPHFDKRGLVLTYQSYEIACYAAGRPTIVVPYKQLKPYLNAKGLALFF